MSIIKHHFRSTTAALLLLSCLATSSRSEEKTGPAAGIPELQGLGKYAGQWEVELTIKSPQHPEGAQASGTSKGEWIHGGHYLRQTWTVKASNDVPAFDGSIIRTYDPHKNEFRAWSFDSNGMTGESVGRWDEKAQTFTWTVKENALGGKSIITSDFSKQGTEDWTMEIQDGGGNALAEVHGIAKRKE